MHRPDSQPRFSVFYDCRIFRFHRPPELDGEAAGAPAAIVGAGPIGMLLAVRLAQFGVRSIVLEQEAQVSGVILDRSGRVARVCAAGDGTAYLANMLGDVDGAAGSLARISRAG